MGLPTRDTTFGTGDNTFAGRVFDVNAIGQGMGISEERMQEILSMKPGRQYSYTLGNAREGDGQIYRTREDAERAMGSGYGGEGIRESSRIIPISGLSDEEALLRGIAATFADERTGGMQAFTKPGSKAAGEDVASLMTLGRTGNVIHPAKMTSDQYEKARTGQEDWFRRQGQKDNDALMGQIMKGVMIAGIAAMTGGALGPLLAGVVGPTVMAGGGLAAGALGGASAGLVGGLTAGSLQSLISGDFNLRNIGMSGLMGMAGGGILGGAAGAFGGGGATVPTTTAQNSAILGLGAGPLRPEVAVQMAQNQLGTGLSQFASPTLQHLANPAASAVVSAGIGTGAGASSSGIIGRLREVAEHPAAKMAVQAGRGGMQGAEAHRMQTMAEQQMSRSRGQVSGSFGRGLQRNPMFQKKLPENEFYDPVADVLSAQEGAVG
jgi:hypothetical protein